MRFAGIAACILALGAACAPCQALNATTAGSATVHSAALAQTKTAKAKPAKKAAQPAQSYVTFFWSKGADGGSLFGVFREKIMLSVDGKDAGKLTQGEYLSVPVEPGHHTYGYERVAISSDGEIKREIDVLPGESVYFEIIEQNEAGIVHKMFPQQVQAEQAQGEISRLKTPLQNAPKEAVTGAPGTSVTPGVPGVSAATPQTGGKSGKKGAGPQPLAQSYITFYWPKRTSGTVAFMQTFGERFGIAVDGQSAGSFGEGQYISVPVQPGAHTYSYARASQISFNEKKHDVDIAPGQSVYFEIAEEQQGMVTVSYPQLVPAEQGRQALTSLSQPARDE